MTLKTLKFLILASKKETYKQWGNDEGLKYTNELIQKLDFMITKATMKDFADISPLVILKRKKGLTP